MNKKKAVKEFVTEHRVRYADTDKSGRGYYAAYLRWFEIGRIEAIRSLGIIYSELEKQGFFAPVVELNVNYKHPVEYDEELLLETNIEKVGTTSIKLGYLLYRKKDSLLLAQASTTHVIVGRSGRPRRIPESIKKLLKEKPLD
ncbi:MAG: thioesterase family protein [Candidatus Altiarchaeota archaeon]